MLCSEYYLSLVFCFVEEVNLYRIGDLEQLTKVMVVNDAQILWFWIGFRQTDEILFSEMECTTDSCIMFCYCVVDDNVNKHMASIQ